MIIAGWLGLALVMTMPADQGARSAAAQEPVRLILIGESSGTVGRYIERSRAANSDAFDERLRAEIEKRGKAAVIRIDASTKVPWQDLTHVIQVCQQAQLPGIELAFGAVVLSSSAGAPLSREGEELPERVMRLEFAAASKDGERQLVTVEHRPQSEVECPAFFGAKPARCAANVPVPHWQVTLGEEHPIGESQAECERLRSLLLEAAQAKRTLVVRAHELAPFGLARLVLESCARANGDQVELTCGSEPAIAFVVRDAARR